MTPTEHYKVAEALLALANEIGHHDDERGRGLLQAAQVHATLATAKIVDSSTSSPGILFIPNEEAAESADDIARRVLDAMKTPTGEEKKS